MTHETIIEKAAITFHGNPLSDDNRRENSDARTAAMYVIRHRLRYTIIATGKLFNRHHASVLAAVQRHKTFMKYDPSYRRKYNEFYESLGKFKVRFKVKKPQKKKSIEGIVNKINRNK